MKVVILSIGLVLSVGACKKTGGGGGGGGGGGWLVGRSGLMVNAQSSGTIAGYDLASTETLNGIACRYSGEAWVVGDHGTLLYTDDAGASWQPQTVPTNANLRTLATQDWGPVYIAGDGVFLTSTAPTSGGAHWTSVGDGLTSFRSVAAAQNATTVLAVSEEGTLWSLEDQQLVGRGTFAGARAVAVSPGGDIAVMVGDNMIARSTDGGRSWSSIALPESIRFDDVGLDDDGNAVAVGSAGALARIGADGRVAVQHLGSADLHAVHIAEVGYDADGLGFAAGEPGNVWITRDGGATWTAGPTVTEAVYGLDMIGLGHR
jgi:photosystem II stability/assembly factor-like uncharacterized protein